MVQGDSCMTAHYAGRERRSYTMIELLTGIEEDSCKTALLAGSKGRSFTAGRIAARLRSTLEERGAATR